MKEGEEREAEDRQDVKEARTGTARPGCLSLALEDLGGVCPAGPQRRRQRRREGDGGEAQDGGEDGGPVERLDAVEKPGNSP